jgi:hypothetical protein
MAMAGRPSAHGDKAVKAEAEAEANAADPLTPYVPFEVLEGGKHSSEHASASARRWWRRWPVVAAALALAAVLALSVGLGVGLAGVGIGGGGGSPPAPLSTPCNGTSSSLIPGDCAAWQAFSNDPLYRAWVEGKCGGSGRAHTDPCSCTFRVKTQCAGGRITAIDMGHQNPSLPGSAGVPLALLDLTGLTLLGLFGAALSNTIPPSLAQLTDLTNLDLGETALSGTIPSTLAQLTGIKGLALDGNSLSGTIPSALAQLTDLTGMTLSRNGLSGTIPSGLAQLTTLISMSLDSNPQLGGILPAFNFSQLTVCCTMYGDPFTCPLPPGAQGCVGGPGCGDSQPPPTCK